jgi:hypothetical protein
MSRLWLRCRYWFDSTLARGTWANIMLLILIALVAATLLTPLILVLTPLDDHGERRGAVATFWETFGKEFRLALPHPGQPWQLMLQLLLGATVVFFGAAVTSVLVSGLIGKLIALRAGGSRVMESGHVVILGWSEQIFTIIDELATAQAGRRKLVVAVLANEDLATMNAAILQRVRQRKHVRVVCRHGVPMDEDDLLLMNLTQARSVILLNPQSSGDTDLDTTTIKTLLALSTQPDITTPVVAALSSTSNMEVARLAGGQQATILDTDDLIARLITHAARQPGVSAILTDLFDFAGAEVRLTRQPTLAGSTFGAALTAFAAAVPIGLVRAGGTVLNPEHHTTLAEDDQLVVLADDYGPLKLVPPGGVQVISSAIVAGDAPPARPVRHLVLGWNRRGPRILADLAENAAPGSIITVVGGEPGAQVIGNAEVTIHSGRASDRSTLADLRVDSYHQIIVLAADGPALAADAQVISTLLHLRAMLGTRRHQCAVVSEVRDDRDRKLVQATRVDDFIVSDHLISLLMAQLAEQSAISDVFAQLLGSENAKVCLPRAADLVQPGVTVNFATIVESARHQGQIAIGYRHTQGTSSVAGFGVVLNPPLATEVVLSEGDQIVILTAERVERSQAA